MINRLILFSFLFHFLSGIALGQTGYSRIKSAGDPPDYILYSTEERFNQARIVLSPYRERDERISEMYYYQSSAFSVNELLCSGNIIYGESTHAYLKKILQKILVENDITDRIEIHMVNNPYVNAFATNEPILFINAGLLAHVRNEAELAFIICHELAHFLKRHGLEKHLENYQYEDLQNDKSFNSYGYFLKKHNFSRKKEAEADSVGLNYFIKSGYNCEAAVTVFDILADEDGLKDPKLLEEILDINSAIDKLSISVKDSLWEYYKSDTLENESFSTHPNVQKRKKSMRQLCNNYSKNSGANFLVGEKEFYDVNRLVRQELVRLNLIHNRYFQSLYQAASNIQSDSIHKEYNEISIVKSIIGILKMKVFDPINHPKFGNLNGLSTTEFQEKSPFKSVLLYYLAYDNNALIQFVENKISKLLESYPNSKEAKSLSNWFSTWKTSLDTKNLDSETTNEQNNNSADVTDKNKIYIDPNFTAIDLRKRYQVDFYNTEKLEKKILKSMLSLNKSYKNKYVMKSVVNKETVTTKDLNEYELINSRLEELTNFPDQISSFPVDYNEMDSLFTASNATNMIYMNAVSAKYKKPRVATVAFCFLFVPLAPLGVYYLFTPSYITQVEYCEINLSTGKKLVTKQSRNNTKLSRSFLHKIYFTK